MHVLDMEKDFPVPETTGFDLQRILEHDCLTLGISSQKNVKWCFLGGMVTLWFPGVESVLSPTLWFPRQGHPSPCPEYAFPVI